MAAKKTKKKSKSGSKSKKSTKSKKSSSSKKSSGKSKKAAAKSAASPTSDGAEPVGEIVKATVSKSTGKAPDIYDSAVKEVVSLSDSDSLARKVDTGPLSEVRGKDVWALHAQLRALDEVASRLESLGSTIQSSVATVDEHLHKNSIASTSLVEHHGSTITREVTTTRDRVQKWINSTQSTLEKNVKDAESSITDAISKAQGAINRKTTDGVKDVSTLVEDLHKTVKDSFEKLSKATAGTEENLRTQTDAFSKATEALLSDIQSDIETKVAEFRDESTRQVDKRFNQTDVAFAAVRADQEVIKALLTDIIKDRMGRHEPKVR